MKSQETKTIAENLKTIPDGKLSVEQHQQDGIPLSKRFHAVTVGKGRIEAYSVFRGVDISFNTFLAPEIKFQHDDSISVLEIYYCHTGRIGWNMRGGTAIYLGAGDISVHSMACCADSAMMFPLGHSEGLSISIDLEQLPYICPEILQEAGIQADNLYGRFCAERPSAILACSELAHIFAPLFSADHSLRLPLLKLKVLELLIYLNGFEPNQKGVSQHVSQQTELIKEIHRYLVEHLNHRFTIEELSKRYLINTSALKEVFKAVYGLPIAAYMKEYRVHQAMKLLRETDASVGEVAAQVGYESQGKFTKAFKDVAEVLPTQYRKEYQNINQL